MDVVLHAGHAGHARILLYSVTHGLMLLADTVR
jgi:hypothetical protein